MKRLAAGLVLALSAACGSTVQVSSQPTPGEAQSDGLGPASAVAQPTAGAGTSGAVTGSPLQGSSAGTAGPAGTVAPGAPGSRPAVGGPMTVGATTGRGFTASVVHVGVEYVDGGDAFTSSAGFGSITTGDTKALVDAVVRDLNRHGGLLGRRIVVDYHATGAAQGASNPQSTAQQVCSDFLTDHPVVAAVIASPAEPCTAKAGLLTSLIGTTLVDSTSLRATAPYARRPAALAWDRLAPTLIDRLTARGFLTPGNKIGLLYPDSTVGARALRTVEAELRRHGLTLARSFAFDDSSQTASAGSVPNAVLPFRSAGVDRVLSTSAVAAYFMITAEQQGYRPRYALHSFMNLASVMESVPPKAQLEGSVGVGWLGPNDVDQPRLDQRPQAMAQCQRYLRDSGQSLSGSALFIQLSYCDSLLLVAQAAQAGGGLDSAALQRGLASAQPKRSALVLDSALSATRMDGASTVRDLGYDAGCACFRYQGATRYPT